jgi:hypothetical protein
MSMNPQTTALVVAKDKKKIIHREFLFLFELRSPLNAKFCHTNTLERAKTP